jgi:hypothetical protein
MPRNNRLACLRVASLVSALALLSCAEGGNSVVTPTGNTSTPTPPAATPAPAAVTGRWVGVAPEGMLIEDGPGACDLDLDLQLDLTASGASVTGTATTKTRRLAPACGGGSGGAVETWPLINGRSESGAISFTLDGGNLTIDFSGTFTASRMAGTLMTVVGSVGRRRGTFAANRQ